MAKKDFIIEDGLEVTGETIRGLLNASITISANLNEIPKYGTGNIEEYRWTLKTPYNQVADIGTNESKITFTCSDYVGNKISSEGKYVISVELFRINQSSYQDDRPVSAGIYGFEVDMVADKTALTEADPGLGLPIPVFVPFVATITDISDNKIGINQSWNSLKSQLSITEEFVKPIDKFENVNVTFKTSDKRDLNTYLHFGGENLLLTTNVKTDSETFETYPHSAVFKLYEPLPDDIEEKDKVYIAREVLPQITEVVELKPYDQEDEDVLVLRVPDTAQVDSPITRRSTNLQSYEDLVTTDVKLQKEIEDKYLTEKSVELNIDYSNYENFVNFSSAEKRLKNFKYKIEQLEAYTAESSSLVGISNSKNDLVAVDNKIRGIKKNLDGYETYLYQVSSSYTTSSMGEFPDATWPKTGSGTFADPYRPVTSSNASFINWYGTVSASMGQLYSASLYDINNSNRLVNLLPVHVKEDVENKQFFDFLDMIGQQFDEIWTYTQAMADITDRQNDLSEGFSKDLIFNLAKSLGWDIQDGKDLLDLSRVGFGQKLSGTTYSLYTSGSLSSPPEGDISKEITKRLVAAIPYLLKAKGTIGSLKGILNCYGIPSSILRVKEYGGLQKQNQRAEFEIARKFTRALRFKGEQYVETTWADDSDSSRKPDTVEFRFRAVSGSDQILVQKDTEWAIKLKDNDSTDNYGTVSFMLTGSFGLQEVSSSLLPVFDGEYHSVMLRKSKIENEIFSFPSFETVSLFNPPFIKGVDNAERGEIKIVSSSNVARSGTKSLSHENTSYDDSSFSKFYKKPPNNITDNISVASVSMGDTYMFTAYAKVSSSAVDSAGRLSLFELDSNEEIVNWDQEFEYQLRDGGVKSSERVGLNETEWKQIVVQKTMKFPNTAKLGVRFENLKPRSTIYWDDISLRKVQANTDSINDNFSYDLFVKKYEAGLDRIIHSSKTTMEITGSTSQSYNASWTGSGTLYLGGHSIGTGSGRFNASRFGGSLMEFRLWTEPLKEQYFNTHVENPKSYVGNSPSSSYYNLVRRFSFDDNSALSDGDELRDISANQTSTQSGSARGFGGENTFETVIDKTKTIIPNHGPNRRMATKIRIENNVLSGSGALLSRNNRYDVSANDFSPLDSPKLGIYFSPTDVVNNDIVESFANLDFNQYLGDPRDNFKDTYPELANVANEYFKKYVSGSVNFWDYMHIIKYYDQSVFKQLSKLIPARAKTHMGTLIEGNIFERPKSPVQQSNPSFTTPYYTDTINVSVMEPEHEDSRSLVIIETEYPNYDGNITASMFRQPALYNFSANDNYNTAYDETRDRNLYISGSAKYGGPNKVFSEPTGAIIMDNRKSVYNKEYKYYYTSSLDFHNSSRYSSDKYVNFYSSRSLVETDLDPEYQFNTALNRSFYEGVTQTIATTTDGDYPIVIRVTAPTVAVPVDATDAYLTVVDTE